MKRNCKFLTYSQTFKENIQRKEERKHSKETFKKKHKKKPMEHLEGEKFNFLSLFSRPIDGKMLETKITSFVDKMKKSQTKLINLAENIKYGKDITTIAVEKQIENIIDKTITKHEIRREKEEEEEDEDEEDED